MKIDTFKSYFILGKCLKAVLFIITVKKKLGLFQVKRTELCP